MTYLGRMLYEKMEHLNPSLGDYIEWDDLPEYQREFYELCAEEVIFRAEVSLVAVPR